MPIRIGICDDEAAELSHLAGLVAAWGEARSEKPAISTWPSAESFLFHWREDRSLDILLLDIQLGGMDGMALAREIRRLDQDLAIIFITGFSDYMQEGYEVDALHYLIKPVTLNKLSPVLARALTRIEKQAPFLLLETGQGIFRLPLEDIRYLEAQGRNTLLHAKEGSHLLHEGISAMEERLSSASGGTPLFFRSHRSILVNLGAVNRISHTELMLTDGTVLPLSRRLYKDACQALLSYIK